MDPPGITTIHVRRWLVTRWTSVQVLEQAEKLPTVPSLNPEVFEHFHREIMFTDISADLVRVEDFDVHL